MAHAVRLARSFPRRFFAGDQSARNTFAGTYAGGFVVRNPDYTVTPEIPVAAAGDLGDDVELTSWVTDSGAGATAAFDGNRDGYGDPYFSKAADTHFIAGTADGIHNWSTLTKVAANKLETLKLDDAKKESAGGVVFASYSRGRPHHFAGLLSTANVGKALLSPPAAAIWKGSMGIIINTAVPVILDTFHLNVTFEGTKGKVQSLNASGQAGNLSLSSGTHINFTGSFTTAGVMRGDVTLFYLNSKP